MSFWHTDSTDPACTQFKFTATPPACVGQVGHQWLMGGVGMAAAIDAAEQSTEKPLLWATIQFSAGSALGDEIDIQVEHMGGGRSIAQVRVTLSVEGRIIQSMLAALGERPGFADQQLISMPDVPPPEGCPAKTDPGYELGDNLLSRLERRMAYEDGEKGIQHLWIRPNVGTDICAPLLGITSDFFLGAHPLSQGGTSLDNTLRVYSTTSTDWILCATQMSGISKGAILGVQHQFTRDGTLLSTSSQTGMLRNRPEA